MERINKKELSKLSLTDKIKRLKEIEEESKKDIKEIKKLIKETEAEMRTSEIASDVGPAAEPVEISSLFKPEESLEGAVSEGASTGEEARKLTVLDYTVRGEESGIEYTGEHEHEMPSPAPAVKIEEQTLYKAASQDSTEKSTSSKGILEEIKKYSRG